VISGITSSDIGMGMLTGGLAGGISAYVGAEWLPKNDLVQMGGRVLLVGGIGGAVFAAYGADFGSGFIQGGATSLFGELLNDMLQKNRMDEGQVNPNKMQQWDYNGDFNPENDLLQLKLSRTAALMDKSLSLNTGGVRSGHSTGLIGLSVDVTVGKEGTYEAGFGLTRHLSAGLNFSDTGRLTGFSGHFGISFPPSFVYFSTTK
jgi:hypothetical protein